MATNLTIAEMKQLIDRLESAREQDVDIPQAYWDRLTKSAELLEALNDLPKIDWDNIKTPEEIEQAEGTLHLKTELLSDIERHLNTCGLTVSGGGRVKGVRKAAGEKRKRSPNRTPEQKAYTQRMAEITKTAKEKLGLPSKGRVAFEDKERLEKEIEKEVKRLKLTPPAA